MFSTKDMENLKNTVKITREVGNTHFSMGSRVALLKAIDCANMGVLQIGEMGIGKTRALECLEVINRELNPKDRRDKTGKRRKVFTKDFTLAGIKEGYNEYFTDSTVTWICKELAKMTVNVLENMFRIVCTLISDHNCQISTSMYDCDIEHSTISWLGATTFEIYNLLLESPLWRGNFSDRILRLYCFPYGIRETNEKIPHTSIELLTPRLDEIEIGTSDRYQDRIRKMFLSQFKKRRSDEYTSRLLKAMALVNGREESLDCDAKFILLFDFNLTCEDIISSKESFSSPLYIDTDPLVAFNFVLEHAGITVEKLIKLGKVKDPKRSLEDIKEETCTILSNYPELFELKGTFNPKVYINPNLLKEKLYPQKKFELMCLERN